MYGGGSWLSLSLWLAVLILILILILLLGAALLVDWGFEDKMLSQKNKSYSKMATILQVESVGMDQVFNRLLVEHKYSKEVEKVDGTDIKHQQV